MNTLRGFLLGLGSCLFLISAAQAQPTASRTAIPTPTDIVQQYLSARTAHDYPKAYALLSETDHQQMPYAEFSKDQDIPGGIAQAGKDGYTPTMAAVSLLFLDIRDTMKYQFSVIGTDPTDPHTVLVRALPAHTDAAKAFLLKLVTAPDDNGIPRIEMLLSYQKTNPADFDRQRAQAQALASLSNLRQIGLAIFQYEQDHHEHMPDADRWVDEITPYLVDKTATPSEQERQIASLFHDPSAPDAQKYNYAFNSRLSGLSLGQIENPAQTVLVFESSAGVKNAADAGASVPHPARHEGGSYYVSADGHAQLSSDVSRLNFAP